MKTHDKLSHGDQVDHNDANALLLAGVTKIINQHDTIAKVEEKNNEIERESLTNKFRIESLENWIIRQEELIKCLSDKLSKKFDKDGVIVRESRQVIELNKKVAHIETEINLSKVFPRCRTQKEAQTEDPNHVKRNIKCHVCGKEFSRNFELEKHIEEHQPEKEHRCDICGKLFYLEWRLNKHTDVHSQNTKVCHFFNNQKPCPYDDIGCKFRHEQTEEAEKEEIIDEDEIIVENQCHLCMKQYASYDNLTEHFKSDHIGFYNDLMKNINTKLNINYS